MMWTNTDPVANRTFSVTSLPQCLICHYTKHLLCDQVGICVRFFRCYRFRFILNVNLAMLRKTNKVTFVPSMTKTSATHPALPVQLSNILLESFILLMAFFDHDVLRRRYPPVKSCLSREGSLFLHRMTPSCHYLCPEPYLIPITFFLYPYPAIS